MLRWRRARRSVVAASLVLIALTTLACLAAAAMMQRSPPWWRRVTPADARTIQTATDVENGITTLFHQERPGEPDASDPAVVISEEWRFTLRAEDANAWLNVRLPAWLTRREELSAWPHEIRQVQVDFRKGAISLGVEVWSQGSSRILSADVRPEIRQDGSLWLPASLVRIGTLPLPAGVVLSGARSRADKLVPVSVRESADSDVLWRAFLGDAAIADAPAVRLPDGRRVRILGLRAHTGVLEVRCRTEWDAPAAARTAPPDR